MAVNKIKNLTLHEILTKVAEVQTKVEKSEVLRQYNCLALRDILKGAFDDDIQFLLPKGAPPYQPAPTRNPPSSLHKMSKRFKYFAVGGPGERMNKAKIESMFIQVLESIHPDDALLVIAMKDKDMAGRYKGVTKKLVSDTFEGLISS
jgi:hypothetical protein